MPKTALRSADAVKPDDLAETADEESEPLSEEEREEVLRGLDSGEESESEEAPPAEASGPEEEASPEDEAADEGDERSEEELGSELFALIFASPDPLPTSRLAKLLGLKGRKKVQAALDALALRLADQGLPLALRSVAGGWRLFTRPEMGELLSGLTERKPDRISPAALETLSIIAYRQPVSKAEIEAIRGVGSGPILRALVDRRLAKVTGRADQPGAPLLYGTTREFLERFGLDSPADLPRDGELNQD